MIHHYHSHHQQHPTLNLPENVKNVEVLPKEVSGIYKEFLYKLRKLEFGTPNIITLRHYPPLFLKDYVKWLLTVPFEDPMHQAYYGDIKKIMTSYLNFYTVCIGQASKQAEHFAITITFEELMDLYNRTLEAHETIQAMFENEFKPIETDEDRERFETIRTEYAAYKEELLDMKDQLILLCHKKQDKLQTFVEEHFPICTVKSAEMCDFSYVFMAKLLVERIPKIRISIEDTMLRIQKNTLEFHRQYEERLMTLRHEMYDLHKEKLYLSRQHRTSPGDTAAILQRINTLKDKIEKFGNYQTFHRLDTENNHWTNKLKEFDTITSAIKKIKDTYDRLTEEEKTLNEYNVEIPEYITQGRQDLENKYITACRSLVTFFCCRGTDRILYTDSAGSYYLDEFGHQNYITRYGAKFFHVGCDGRYTENSETDKYYFDQIGRYIIENGQKVYQIASCTSKYHLGEDGLFRKTEICSCTENCGKGAEISGTCNVDVKDLTDVEILPKTKVIDIEKTLDSETVKYLWDSFGWILPEVLNEVADLRPKNPIHYFGHVLLTTRYGLTEKEIKKRKKEAQKYRDDILRKRSEDARAQTLAWKSKEMKPTKVEDSSAITDTIDHIKRENQLVEDWLRFNDDFNVPSDTHKIVPTGQ